MTALRLLAVFAHPDDETFRPGGMLALLARAGVQVQVLTATRGEAGSRGEPPLCRPEDLPALRERELACACAVLGLQPPSLLDYQDGHLAEVSLDMLTRDVLAAIEAVQPQVLLSFGLDGLSGHPDHIAIGRAARLAFEHAPQVAALYTLAVPRSLAEKVQLPQLQAVPDAEIDLAIDVTPVWDIKLAAMHCHASQLNASPLLHAPEAQQRLFFGQEFFIKAAEWNPAGNFLPRVLG
jgi:N-acetylglucosamine malate deacetylase 2